MWSRTTRTYPDLSHDGDFRWGYKSSPTRKKTNRKIRNCPRHRDVRAVREESTSSFRMKRTRNTYKNS